MKYPRGVPGVIAVMHKGCGKVARAITNDQKDAQIKECVGNGDWMLMEYGQLGHGRWCMCVLEEAEA